MYTVIVGDNVTTLDGNRHPVS